MCVCARPLPVFAMLGPDVPTSCPGLPSLSDLLPQGPGTLEMSTMEFTCSRSFLCFSRTWRNLWEEAGGQK